MIRGVIFDMDGIILDSEKIYFSCWRQSAMEFGFDMKPEYALAVRSCCQPYAEPYLKRVLGEQFDYLAIRNRRRELVSKYMAEHGVEVKKGVRELVSYCREHNILPVIATATARKLAEDRLELAGIGGVFTEIIGGDEVTIGKPHPCIYQTAAANLGLNPEECLALEDSPNGVTAAFAAGCKTVMIPDLTQPEHSIQPLLYGIAEDLTEVIRIIAAANAEKGEGIEQ